MANVSPELGDLIVQNAQKELEAGLTYRKARFAEIKKNEDLVNDKPRPTIAGRFNVPIDSVIMQGFKQTLLSKIDNPPVLKFSADRSHDLIAAKKVQAAWEKDSAPDRGRWAEKDLQGKALNIDSGRTIFKYFASGGSSKYESNLELIDHYDFVCSGRKARLDNDDYKYQMNVMLSEKRLLSGKQYYKAGVKKLIAHHLEGGTVSGTVAQKPSEEHSRDRVREALGFDTAATGFVSTKKYNLVEGETSYNDEQYYVLFDKESGIWARCEPFADVFESKLTMFTSWAYLDDPFNFWSKGALDPIRVIAEAAKIIFNQTLDNIQKRNWDMTAFDKNIFPNPEQFNWKPRGLVKANVKAGQSIQQGIYHFQTPDTTGVTINMMQYIKSFLGQETGITAGAQGQSDVEKVGIYFGDMQQVADRLSLQNKHYSQCYVDLGQRYDWGLFEHLPENFMVEYIGLDGREWDILKKEDVDPDLKVAVTAGSVEQTLSELKARKRTDAITKIINAGLATDLNKRLLIEGILRDGEFDESYIRALMDSSNDLTDEMIARADKAIYDIIRGKQPRTYRGATEGYIQRIINYAYDNVHNKDEQKDLAIFTALAKYAQAHIEIAKENMARKIIAIRNQQAMMSLGQPAPAEATGKIKSAENVKPATVAVAEEEVNRAVAGVRR